MMQPATKVVETPEQAAIRRASLLQAVAQLDMLVGAFQTIAPEEVLKTGKDFKAALEKWANG